MSADIKEKVTSSTRKVIGLMPVKNESWIIKTTIPQIKKYCDEILALDGGSSDDTVALLEEMGVHVAPQEGNEDQYSAWRQYLLNWGRRRGGTHFVWLDADEAFTANFLQNFSHSLAQLKPGQKLVMDWLCLWKSPYALRTDESVWSKNYKDFIFYDDGISHFSDTRLHEGRTPGENTEARLVRLPREQGAVLHFQFAAFRRFQAKQAFQRCRELFLKMDTAVEINRKYAITLDEAHARVTPLPVQWLETFRDLDTLQVAGYDWFYQAILDYFEKSGIVFYEPLEIWHLPELKQLFIEKLGREPISLRKDAFWAKKLSAMRRFVSKRLPPSLKRRIKAICEG